MSCIATATKGKMFDVRDAVSLNTSIAEAVKLANLDQGSPSGEPQAAKRPTASAPDAPAGAPGVRLSAALAANGPALTRPVAWRIAKNETPNETLSAAVRRRDRRGSDTRKVPRRRQPRRRKGASRSSRSATRGRRASASRSMLARVKLMARATKAGDPIANPVLSIAAAPEAPGARRVREPVWIGRDPDAEVVVPAGNYVARVEDGLASREAAVTVAPGSLSDAQLVLGCRPARAHRHHPGRRRAARTRSRSRFPRTIPRRPAAGARLRARPLRRQPSSSQPAHTMSPPRPEPPKRATASPSARAAT